MRHLSVDVGRTVHVGNKFCLCLILYVSIEEYALQTADVLTSHHGAPPLKELLYDYIFVVRLLYL